MEDRLISFAFYTFIIIMMITHVEFREYTHYNCIQGCCLYTYAANNQILRKKSKMKNIYTTVHPGKVSGTSFYQLRPVTVQLLIFSK